jgi:hypothetical protein
MRWIKEEEDRLVYLFLKYGPSWELIRAKDKQMGQVISNYRIAADLKNKLRTIKIKMMRLEALILVGFNEIIWTNRAWIIGITKTFPINLVILVLGRGTWSQLVKHS